MEQQSGIFWIFYIIIFFDGIFGGIINDYSMYEINPLPRVLFITLLPLILIILGYVGIYDFNKRKKVSKKERDLI